MVGEKSASVVFVLLRRPGKNDRRRDPLFEHGCFGLTGCHNKNVLADSSARGRQLAFAQGGPFGFRLVMLTPPVDIRAFPLGLRAAFWKPGSLPLRYRHAPIIIDNSGRTDCPALLDDLVGVSRSSWEGRFSSKFRSRKAPTSTAVARQLRAAWRAANADSTTRATDYWQSLPRRPAVVDDDRDATYDALLRRALGTKK